MAAQWFERAKKDDNAAAFVKLKQFVAQQLASGKRDTAEMRQLALCYQLGFGTDVDKTKAAALGLDAATVTDAEREGAWVDSNLNWHNGLFLDALAFQMNSFGMQLGLGGSVPFFGGELELSGEFSDRVRDVIAPSVERFYDKEHKAVDQSACEDLAATYCANQSLAGNRWANDVQACRQLRAQLRTGKTACCVSGWPGHSITLSFHQINGKIYMAYTNRGERRDDQISGTRLFRVTKPEFLESDKGLQNLQCGDGSHRDYLETTESATDGIGKDLGLVEVVEFEQSDQ